VKAPALNIITEYIIGYIYPGYPVANILFKVYGNVSMKQAIFFLQDFKLGHYMKIPPREMFLAQVFPPTRPPFKNREKTKRSDSFYLFILFFCYMTFQSLRTCLIQTYVQNNNRKTCLVFSWILYYYKLGFVTIL